MLFVGQWVTKATLGGLIIFVEPFLQTGHLFFWQPSYWIFLFQQEHPSLFSVTPVYRHIFLVRFKVTGVIKLFRSDHLDILSVFIIKAPIATRNSSSPNKVQVGRRRAGSGRPRSQPWKVTWSHGRCQTKYFLWVKSLSLKRPKLYFPVIIPTLQDSGKRPSGSWPGTGRSND